MKVISIFLRQTQQRDLKQGSYNQFHDTFICYGNNIGIIHTVNL